MMWFGRLNNLTVNVTCEIDSQTLEIIPHTCMRNLPDLEYFSSLQENMEVFQAHYTKGVYDNSDVYSIYILVTRDRIYEIDYLYFQRFVKSGCSIRNLLDLYSHENYSEKIILERIPWYVHFLRSASFISLILTSIGIIYFIFLYPGNIVTPEVSDYNQATSNVGEYVSVKYGVVADYIYTYEDVEAIAVKKKLNYYTLIVLDDSQSIIVKSSAGSNFSQEVDRLYALDSSTESDYQISEISGRLTGLYNIEKIDDGDILLSLQRSLKDMNSQGLNISSPQYLLDNTVVYLSRNDILVRQTFIVLVLLAIMIMAALYLFYFRYFYVNKLVAQYARSKLVNTTYL